MGMYSEAGIFTAYGSLSNPFNLARVCYNLEHMFWGRIVSRIMASTSKEHFAGLRGNPVFRDILRHRRLDNREADADFSGADTYWELNANYTYRIAGGVTRLRRRLLVLRVQVLRTGAARHPSAQLVPELLRRPNLPVG